MTKLNILRYSTKLVLEEVGMIPVAIPLKVVLVLGSSELSVLMCGRDMPAAGLSIRHTHTHILSKMCYEHKVAFHYTIRAYRTYKR